MTARDAVLPSPSRPRSRFPLLVPDDRYGRSGAPLSRTVGGGSSTTVARGRANSAAAARHAATQSAKARAKQRHQARREREKRSVNRLGSGAGAGAKAAARDAKLRASAKKRAGHRAMTARAERSDDATGAAGMFDDAAAPFARDGGGGGDIGKGKGKGGAAAEGGEKDKEKELGPPLVFGPSLLIVMVCSVLFGLFTACMMCDQWSVATTNIAKIDRLKGACRACRAASRSPRLRLTPRRLPPRALACLLGKTEGARRVARGE